jgi:hypothetical protein
LPRNASLNAHKINDNTRGKLASQEGNRDKDMMLDNKQLESKSADMLSKTQKVKPQAK